MADRTPQRPTRPDSPRSGEARRRTDRAEKPARRETERPGRGESEKAARAEPEKPARRERTDVSRKGGAGEGSSRAARPAKKGLPPLATHLGAIVVGLGLGIPLGLVLAPDAAAPAATPAAPESPGPAAGDGRAAAELAEARAELDRTRTMLADAKRAAPTGEWAGEPNEIVVKVIRVLDGDTFEAEGYEKRFRYLGINAPEKFVDYYAKEAWAQNEAFVLGKQVRVVFDGPHTDDLGRHLGYIYVGDTLVNLELVKGGYAPLFDDPRTRSIQQYQALLAAASAAKSSGVGYWDDEARARWETTFQPEAYYNCTKGTVHRPRCPDGENAKTTRIEDIETAMKKRKACRECVPTRHHPVYGPPEEEEK